MVKLPCGYTLCMFLLLNRLTSMYHCNFIFVQCFGDKEIGHLNGKISIQIYLAC